jgi:hypothetical protein
MCALFPGGIPEFRAIGRVLETAGLGILSTKEVLRHAYSPRLDGLHIPEQLVRLRVYTKPPDAVS